MPLKREPVSVRLVPSTRGEVTVVICGCQSGLTNPSPISYSSALAEGLLLLSRPPATSAMPLGNKVAVCLARAVLRLPVAAQVPLAGSNSSALVEAVLELLIPTATRIMNLDCDVAVG